jgi:hypothetical protein
MEPAVATFQDASSADFTNAFDRVLLRDNSTSNPNCLISNISIGLNWNAALTIISFGVNTPDLSGFSAEFNNGSNVLNINNSKLLKSILHVYNVIGAMVYSKSINTIQDNTSLAHLPKGLYTAAIIANNKKVFVKKIIKY